MRPTVSQEAKERILPKFPHFTKLALAHQPIIERYTHKFPPYSDYTFPSLWFWNEGDGVELSDLYGNLVVKFLDYFSKELFLSVLGNNQFDETLNDLFDFVTPRPDYLNRLQFIPEHNLHAWHDTLDEY